MIDGINNLTKVAGDGALPALKSTGEAGGSSFADVLKSNIEQVNRLQQDASQAVQDLATGRTDDVVGVMTAMEKSDIAFKTLLAIRAKLMDAYEEVRNMPV
jgi:flagellar hook-basal body complex protein FliE